MPKCYKCGHEQPLLYSYYTAAKDAEGKTKMGSFALCDRCLKEAQEAGKR